MDWVRKFPWRRCYAILLLIATLPMCIAAVLLEGPWVAWLAVNIGTLVLARVESIHDIIRLAKEDDEDDYA